MDVELKKMQFMGICEIFHETCKLVHKWRKIFTQITLAFILPISLSLLANMEISNFFIQKITHEKIMLLHTQKSTPKFQDLFHLISSQRTHLFLFNIASFIFSTVFALLLVSAVVYTVACIYTARDVSLKHVISVLPKIWKRLLVTFLWLLAAWFALNFAAILVFFFVESVALSVSGKNNFKIILVVFAIFYLVAFWGLMIIWQLSYVVSVLEESCGFGAMARSKALIEGKMVVAMILFLLLNLPVFLFDVVFNHMVVRSVSMGLVGKGIVGIIWVLSFLLNYLIKFVAETVLYFVCKSYHQESIDKSTLSSHLQGYLMADYVPLKVDDDVHVELEVV